MKRCAAGLIKRKSSNWILPAALLPVFFMGSAVHGAEPARRQEVAAAFSEREPSAWGETLPGVRTRLKTEEKVIALTLDACGSEGDGYDEVLISFLEENQVPATLFMNARWIDKNPEVFARLAANPLFEIENHGTAHRPASVTGRSAFDIPGTAGAAELVDEIEINADKIEALTGRRPVFYRSGTAYYDDVALDIIGALGYQAVGFNVLGDKGATYLRDKVRDRLFAAAPGSIVILHMNRPERQTAEGVMAALPELLAQGFRFVQLQDYELE